MENTVNEILTKAQVYEVNAVKLDLPHFILDDHVRQFIKIREDKSHKGNYGHAMIVGGSYGKMGAAVLASKSCLRSGIGLLTVFIPKCGYNILQTSAPEAMCLTDENEKWISQLPKNLTYQTIGIGPGIGTEKETIACLQTLLSNFDKPLVMDADALNIMAENPTMLKNIPQNSIVTPHIKEFERLVGSWNSIEERFEKQKQFAQEYECIVVLKDSKTCICSPNGELFINTSGNAGMATGGSGDVLTGIITSLVGQGYLPLHAALIGVYFHGKAGDMAAEHKGMNALIASDIVDYLKIERN